jgi:hypothetical protein
LGGELNSFCASVRLALIFFSSGNRVKWFSSLLIGVLASFQLTMRQSSSDHRHSGSGGRGWHQSPRTCAPLGCSFWILSSYSSYSPTPPILHNEKDYIKSQVRMIDYLSGCGALHLSLL